MLNRQNPLYWSFPLGSWFSTRVRVSVFFPLVLLVLCFRLEDLQLGLVVGFALFLSVLAHEFGHILAARYTGGSGNEVLIWPLGGLAEVRPANNLSSSLWTSASGPLVNLLLCGITVVSVVRAEVWRESLNPFTLPPVNLATDPAWSCLLILFSVNWVLLVVNLLPVFPLDGGRMLHAILEHSLGREQGTQIYARVGTIVALLGMFAGLLMDHTAVLFVGSIVLVLNMHEAMRRQSGDDYDDSFMGYDFSQGYTSLEREEPAGPIPASTPGPWARWKERRRLERERRQRERDAQIDQQLDDILEKVHVHGIESLSKEERAVLDHASSRYQQRENTGD